MRRHTSASSGSAGAGGSGGGGTGGNFGSGNGGGGPGGGGTGGGGGSTGSGSKSKIGKLKKSLSRRLSLSSRKGSSSGTPSERRSKLSKYQKQYKNQKLNEIYGPHYQNQNVKISNIQIYKIYQNFVIRFASSSLSPMNVCFRVQKQAAWPCARGAHAL